MSYRVLYIEKTNHLQLYLDNLKIEKDNGDLLFPINDILILVIDNYKSSLTIPLINKLVDNNVCTVICGIDHLPRSFILPMNGHFSQSGNIRRQIEWSDEIKSKLHKCIVKAKIINQIEILKKYNKDSKVISRIMEFSNEVKDSDTTNREGLSAKMYFRELFGNDFIRFENDVINAGLNYGYAIFRSLISSIIVAKGFLPNIGLFHIGKTNMFNLSDDIIEVFRPIVDDLVYCTMSDEILFKSTHRDELIKLTLKKVEIDDKFQTVANAINLYIESILKVIETNDTDYFIFPSPLYRDNDI